MVLRNDYFTVAITQADKPALCGVDIIYNTENMDLSDFHMAWIIHVEPDKGAPISIALIDLICSGYEPCAVLEDHELTVILFQSIVRLDLNSGELIQRVECDNMGGLFQIHPISDGYIIWGEGELFRYSRSLERIWWYAGRDILVSPKGEPSFWSDGETIHCIDWENWHYVVDMNGKLIDNFQV